MRTYLLFLWDTARNSYWFVPSLFAAGALLLATLMPMLDEAMFRREWNLPDSIQTTTETARVTLSAIAGAMIAVTGTVFSITIVTLSLTSQQFGPRLLRRFTSDLTMQITLGVFLSTGFYCLLLLRVVEQTDEGLSAPHLSVLLAVLFSVFSMLMLIVFIHHVSTLIQAPNVVAAVARDLDDAIVRLFPEKIGAASEQSSEREDPDTDAIKQQYQGECLNVSATSEGYIQAMAADSLLEWAKEQDVVVRLLARPGDFIAIDTPLAEIRQSKTASKADALLEDATEVLNDNVIVGARRTPRQDVECAIDELVEVAVRSLSPGINDPFTAINCIDRLGASLSRLAQRQTPSAFRLDEDDQLRIIARPVKFPDVLDAAFNQIRQYGKDSVAVTIRLLEALSCIASQLQCDEDKQAVAHHAKMTNRMAENFPEETDRQAIHERYERLVRDQLEMEI